MYFKLAINNVKKSFKDYAVYFLTLMFGVCIFYVFNSIESQRAMMLVSQTKDLMMSNLCTIIGYISIFIAIVLGFLILYANKFLIRRRKKELGIYMTLGMDKSKISFVLVLETFMIGLCSLVVGLGAGVFLSQGLSVFTAKMFEVDMSKFQFVFSKDAFVKSILCFGIIYTIVMIFNVFSISKCKLIDLIYGDKKNETPKVKNLWISVILFALSVACLTTSYAFIIDNGLNTIDSQFYAAFVFAFIGTFLFFMSLSGFLLKVIQWSKKLYYKDLNIFILRQINSKINTTYISMTFICLMLAVTIVSLSSGMATSQSMRDELQKTTPHDASMVWEKGQNDKEIVSVKEELKKYGMNVDDYAKAQLEVPIYESQVSYRKVLDAQSLGNNSLYNKALLDRNMKVISVTDYNKILRMQGKEGITLEKSEFAINCNQTDIVPLINKYLKDNKILNYNNIELQSKFTKPLENVLYVCVMRDDSGTLILPDGIIDRTKISKIILNIDYSSPQMEEKIMSEIDTTSKRYGDKLKEVKINGLTKEIVYDSSIGLSAIMTFLTLYISIVFLLTSAAVLALQQLTEATDNKVRYNLLSKLGTDKAMTNKALFTQIAIYFAVPLFLAIIHGIIGIYVANKVIVLFGKINVLPNIIFTAAIFVLIYGGYFLATYFSSKNIVNRN